MAVKVERNGVVMICTTKEQLQIFLEDGYSVVEEKAEKPKTATKKKKGGGKDDAR